MRFNTYVRETCIKRPDRINTKQAKQNIKKTSTTNKSQYSITKSDDTLILRFLIFEAIFFSFPVYDENLTSLILRSKVTVAIRVHGGQRHQQKIEKSI